MKLCQIANNSLNKRVKDNTKNIPKKNEKQFAKIMKI
jgi:hypothetical protein